jgi:hypothetical protein
MILVAKQLNDALRAIQEDCQTREFKRYREGFGHVLGNLFTRVLSPIYAEHPSLTPRDLRAAPGSRPARSAARTGPDPGLSKADAKARSIRRDKL